MATEEQHSDGTHDASASTTPPTTPDEQVSTRPISTCWHARWSSVRSSMTSWRGGCIQRHQVQPNWFGSILTPTSTSRTSRCRSPSTAHAGACSTAGCPVALAARMSSTMSQVIANINERTFPSRPSGAFALVDQVPRPPSGRSRRHHAALEEGQKLPRASSSRAIRRCNRTTEAVHLDIIRHANDREAAGAGRLRQQESHAARDLRQRRRGVWQRPRRRPNAASLRRRFRSSSRPMSRAPPQLDRGSPSCCETPCVPRVQEVP